jgi:hypothetical protein
MKTSILTLIFELVILAVNAQVGEQTKFKMFCSALNYYSTAPNYIVIIVKNKKTMETKEVCAESPAIEGAVMRESGNWKIDCKNYKTRYFEFTKDSALRDIGFNLYTKDELEKYSKTIKVVDIVQQIKSGKLTSKTFMGDKKEQLMFAHLMFNNGVMVTRGCIAGNICGLTSYKSK